MKSEKVMGRHTRIMNRSERMLSKVKRVICNKNIDMLLIGFGHNFNLCNNLELANCFSMHLLSYRPHKMLLALESLMQSSACVFAYKNRMDQMQVSLA